MLVRSPNNRSVGGSMPDEPDTEPCLAPVPCHRYVHNAATATDTHTAPSVTPSSLLLASTVFPFAPLLVEGGDHACFGLTGVDGVHCILYPHITLHHHSFHLDLSFLFQGVSSAYLPPSLLLSALLFHLSAVMF